jgi:mono/diheme cytochrome c family protein
MKSPRTTLAIAAAVALMTTIGIRADHPVFPIKVRPRSAQQPVSETARLYRLHCQMCHGANGKAPIPEMAMVGRKWKHGTSSAQMAKIISEGVKGTAMKPFKGKLKPEQILALAKHVRAFDPSLKPEK